MRCLLAVTVVFFTLAACRDTGTKRKDEPLPEHTAVCGDGQIDTGEDCDGSDLAMATCVSLGFDTGALSCGADCKFATGLCVKRCGNGVLDPGETCDGKIGLSVCENFGYVACSTSCAIDSTHCILNPLGDGPSLAMTKGGPTFVADISPPGPGDLVMAVPSFSRIETFPWSLQVGFSMTGSRKLSFNRTPMQVAVADLSADGVNDIAAINDDNSIDQYTYNGSGFTPQTLDAGCAAGRFVAGLHTSPDSGVNGLLLDCAGTALVISRGTAVSFNAGTHILAAADFNRDGITDVLGITGASPATVQVLLAPLFASDGGVTITGAPSAIAAGDLDNDGDVDLVAVTATGLTIYEFVNGAWAEKATVISTSPANLTIADVDLDGLSDLFYTSGDDVVLRRNRGQFVFSEFKRSAGPGTRLSTSLGDVDGDGDLDVAVTVSTGVDSTQTNVVVNRVR